MASNYNFKEIDERVIHLNELHRIDEEDMQYLLKSSHKPKTKISRKHSQKCRNF